MLIDAGFDAVLVENMHDTPYLRRHVGPEIVATMTLATAAVVEVARNRARVGVQILAGANTAALAVAMAAGADFIRAEGFAYAAVADEGLLDEADAGPLLRYRRSIDADHIGIWSDVRKKHSAHAITGDLELRDLVAGHAFMGAEAIIITGPHTGSPVATRDLEVAAEAGDRPVIVGSGATPDHLGSLFRNATGVIVGSALKEDGDWRRDLCPDRIRAFIDGRG